MKLPIAGYTGHRKGLKAENVYAKSFRCTTFDSERLLRAKLSTHSNFNKP